MPRFRPFTILLALIAALVVATPANATAAPSAKRCKAVKAKQHKTKRDRTVLAQCRKQAATTAAKQKAAAKQAAATPAATPAPGPVGGVAVPTAPAPGAPSGAAAPAPVTTSTPTPTPELPQIPVGTGRAVQVRGFEFGLNLSRAHVLAGTVRVEYNLVSAEDPHSLVLFRADGTGAEYRFDEQGSGTVLAKSLPLTTGRWRLVCDLPGHTAAGMQVDLEVR